MSLALKKVALAVGLACALASASLAHAQTAGGNTEEKLTEINKRIEVLTTAMAERASGYPEVVAKIREKREKIDRAEVEVQQMIDDLKKTTQEMDINSPLHGELTGLDERILKLIAQLEEAKDPKLEDLLKKVKARRELTLNLDKRRAEAVINARATIRDLEDNQERLVLIKQIGAIDAAIAILETSISDFEAVVKDAQAIAADVTVVITSP